MDALKLIEDLAQKEEQLGDQLFLAPAVAGGRVRVRIDGLIQELEPNPADFAGWGLFLADGKGQAVLMEEAGRRHIDGYLGLLRPLRVRLAWRLSNEHRSWIAYPIGEGDAAQRFGEARPIIVHLVADEADAFEQVVVRADGGAFWYEDLDRRGNPRTAERLREAARENQVPNAVQIPGMTPEERTTYALAYSQVMEIERRREARREARRERHQRQLASRDENRLRDALRLGGGELADYRDRGDYWVVEWTTRSGETHSSAISKNDLTVLSAGICLDGGDRAFDLQSLVGVVENADYWAY